MESDGDIAATNDGSTATATAVGADFVVAAAVLVGRMDRVDDEFCLLLHFDVIEI